MMTPAEIGDLCDKNPEELREIIARAAGLLAHKSGCQAAERVLDNSKTALQRLAWGRT